MKKIDKTQLLILILIVMTVFSLFKMNQLTTKVAQLQWQLSAQEKSISNQIGGIENIVHQMKEADRWYQEVEAPKLNFVKDEFQLKLSFKLLEYIKESKVSFHVRNFGSDEFITYSATDNGSGIYEIQLSEFGPLNPVLKLDVSFSNPDTMMLLDFDYSDYENILEYYISVEHGDVMRISETLQVHMYELAYDIFQPISGQIKIDDENNLIETNLESNIMDNFVYYTLDRVEIQAYKDNKMVEWWELKPLDTDSNGLQFVDTLETTEEYDHLYIEVKYIGHNETSKSIYKRIIGSKR
ncbi:MAG: hypothetical protein IBX70_12650 [Clostridia bacterium]|nr:hypothetical protein [Clostridia bacterium]